MNIINKPKAIILTGGIFKEMDAKTAHGLIRSSDRFEIVGVIDDKHSGYDAGELLDGIHRNIPIFESVEDAHDNISNIEYCIIGIATVGGILPQSFMPIIKTCISYNISIVNGLHDFLNNMSDIVRLAKNQGVQLIDVRKPKDKKDLHFWTGEIYNVKALIIAVIGTDCAIGKRTTCRMITHACEEENIHAKMIYTGQTGWLQGGQYGFIFDSTLNDFISGEIESAVVQCASETNADIILIEGQSSLRNPSGPCGSEFIISGNAKHVIIVHAPKRIYYEDIESWGEIPSITSEIALITMYGASVMAIALNTENCTLEEAFQFQKDYEQELNIPVLLPLHEGVKKVIPYIKKLIK